MHEAAVAVSLWLAAAWVGQLALALGYLAASRRRPTAPPGAPPLPRFGVVMPVRGLEPSLPEAIASVLSQDYPSFELHVVVDGPDDPAWPVVGKALAGASNARRHALEERRPACSLVCSSLLQALERLDPSCELLAFAAADLVAPRDWLRRLAAGLVDAEVAGTLGNRWYVPPEGRWGSLVRQQWNAGAVVIMQLLRIPWAGGLALRRRDVESLGLRPVWERSLVEDVSVVRPARAAGRTLRFLPGLLVANREEIDLPGAFRFIARQLVWARLHHPAWPVVLLHSLAGSVTLAAPLLVALAAVAAGEPGAACLSIGALTAYLAALTALVVPMEAAVRPHLRESGQEPQRWSLRFASRFVLAAPLTQVVFTAAAVKATLAREITWSGVTYSIRGPLDVRLVSDARHAGSAEAS